MAIAIAFHILAAVIWVGGMFFAYHALRPAAASLLEPPQRLTLWIGVFKRFFPWVWASIVTLLSSGYWMVFRYFGGFETAGTHIHLMHAAGLLMMLIFFHVFFAPFKRLQQAVIIKDFPQAAGHLNQIRLLVGTNTLIGLSVLIIASAGRYL